MGQEAFDVGENVQEKHKQKGDINMLRKTKRTLSLVLALIMICSAMGVMAFAQERGVMVCHECPQRTCGSTQCVEKNRRSFFNRVIECPTHGGHDAEEYYVYVDHHCANCGVEKETFILKARTYVCLD